MTDPVQAFRARVINLCFSVIDACELSDLHTITCQAHVLLEEMGIEPTQDDNYEDLL